MLEKETVLLCMLQVSCVYDPPLYLPFHYDVIPNELFVIN